MEPPPPPPSDRLADLVFWIEQHLDDPLTVEIIAKELKAATYLVFRITLQGGPLHPQIKNAMAKIWGELVPASGLKLADAPDFERHDGEFAPTRPGAVIDFHIPVEV